jgi:hypothetical protein
VFDNARSPSSKASTFARVFGCVVPMFESQPGATDSGRRANPDPRSTRRIEQMFEFVPGLL